MDTLNTKEAKVIMQDVLQRYKFDYDKPDYESAFYAFKEFMGMHFETANDLMFFESELSTLTGEKLFQISFVRQFSDSNNKCRQLQLDIFYEPLECFEDVGECIWLDDFSTKDEFFTAILNSKTLTVLTKNNKPLRSELYFDDND